MVRLLRADARTGLAEGATPDLRCIADTAERPVLRGVPPAVHPEKTDASLFGKARKDRSGILTGTSKTGGFAPVPPQSADVWMAWLLRAAALDRGFAPVPPQSADGMIGMALADGNRQFHRIALRAGPNAAAVNDRPGLPAVSLRSESDQKRPDLERIRFDLIFSEKRSKVPGISPWPLANSPFQRFFPSERADFPDPVFSG